jgi:hypothetical protein
MDELHEEVQPVIPASENSLQIQEIQLRTKFEDNLLNHRYDSYAEFQVDWKQFCKVGL